MFRAFKSIIALMALAGTTSAGATTFEDWSSPQLNVGGTIGSDGQVWVLDASKRWVINNWKPDCNAALAGPNTCYAPSNGRLYVHAEMGGKAGEPTGDGFLLASLNKVSFTNGIIIEVPVSPVCYQSPNPAAPPTQCGLNVGIYESEQNYRSIGFRTFPGTGSSMFFNIWGPTLEANFNGAAPFYNYLPITAGSTYTLKLQYWNSSSGWRWDYSLNGTWVAGHPANPDNQFNLGPAYFPNREARLQIAAFSYTRRPDDWVGPFNAAEGWFGAVTYSTF
ncbi:hypothetical protein CYFUS_001653 [Cystobacter fuscus]|uniref:Uncharacterized protein n=1 Tax=Cystobacter fuscus TaxID=43 RepID=A0A250IWY5_9BACT|nr:hypothetical protein [Cystobacter fuscus]ATB36239.1 hypothetical protein CYFUS_001653 [Cystobacter fuscus]